MYELENQLNDELKALRKVKDNFKVGKKVKRIKFGKIEREPFTSKYQLKVHEGEYLGTKRTGNMFGVNQAETFYRVKVIFNDEEFKIFRVTRDEVLELIEG